MCQLKRFFCTLLQLSFLKEDNSVHLYKRDSKLDKEWYWSKAIKEVKSIKKVEFALKAEMRQSVLRQDRSIHVGCIGIAWSASLNCYCGKNKLSACFSC